MSAAAGATIVELIGDEPGTDVAAPLPKPRNVDRHESFFMADRRRWRDARIPSTSTKDHGFEQ
jgi:hypothetical protein